MTTTKADSLVAHFCKQIISLHEAGHTVESVDFHTGRAIVKLNADIELGGLSEKERTLLAARDKIGAVKEYRSRTGCSLVDAKTAVERYMSERE